MRTIIFASLFLPPPTLRANAAAGSTARSRALLDRRCASPAAPRMPAALYRTVQGPSRGIRYGEVLRERALMLRLGELVDDLIVNLELEQIGENYERN